MLAIHRVFCGLSLSDRVFCILHLSFSLLVMLELTINNYDRISVVMNQVKEQNMKVEPKIIDAEGEEEDF